jgi:hypothetical protein
VRSGVYRESYTHLREAERIGVIHDPGIDLAPCDELQRSAHIDPADKFVLYRR